MSLGLPAGISLPPGCGSDPRKKNPLPGLVFGRVWSCLVRSNSLSLASLLRRLNWASGITAPVISCLFMAPVHDELFLHLVLIIPPYCSYSAAHLGTR
jgi:hypothetical protein